MIAPARVAPPSDSPGAPTSSSSGNGVALIAAPKRSPFSADERKPASWVIVSTDATDGRPDSAMVSVIRWTTPASVITPRS